MPVIHLRVSGRVHGVGFRHFVWTHATTLGLSGWVRNTHDGAVELAASGSAEALASLAALVQSGPPSARVSSVVQLASAAGGTYFLPFRILTGDDPASP